MLPHEVVKETSRIKAYDVLIPQSKVVEPNDRSDGRIGVAYRAKLHKPKVPTGPFISKSQILAAAEIEEAACSAERRKISSISPLVCSPMTRTRVCMTSTTKTKAIDSFASFSSYSRLFQRHQQSYEPLKSAPPSPSHVKQVDGLGVRSKWMDIPETDEMTTVIMGTDNMLPEEQIVEPGSMHHRLSPDRAGYVSPPRGNRKVLDVPSSSQAPIHGIISVNSLCPSPQMKWSKGTHPPTTSTAVIQLRQAVADQSPVAVVVDQALGVEGVVLEQLPTASRETMMDLLQGYEMTENDVLPQELYEDIVSNGGVSLLDLVPSSIVQINLKALPINVHPPDNNFLSVSAPKMKINPNVFIPTQLPPTYAAMLPTRDDKGQPVSTLYHLIVDLSEWNDVHFAPVLRITNPFLRDIGFDDHHLDRSLTYRLQISRPECFLSSTPKMLYENENAQVLLMAVNSNVCGDALLTIQLVDNGSVDSETLEPMASGVHCVVLHFLRKGVTAVDRKAAVSAVSNLEFLGVNLPNGVTVMPNFNSLLAEDKAKIIYCKEGECVPIETENVGEDRKTTAAVRIDDEALYRPFVLPNPNANLLREDCVIRNNLEILQQYFSLQSQKKQENDKELNVAGMDSLKNNNNKNIVTNEEDMIKCLLNPIAVVLNPVFPSCVSALELAGLVKGLKLRRILGMDEVKSNNDLVMAEEVCLSRVVEIEKAEGVMSTKLIPELLSLVQLYVNGGSQRRQGDAIETLERIVRIKCADLGFLTASDIGKEPVPPRREEDIAQLIQFLLLISYFLQLLGRHGEAQELCTYALNASENYIGCNSEPALDSYLQLAHVMALYGDYHQASNLFEKSITIADTFYGENSFASLEIIQFLGLCRICMGDYVNAIGCQNRVLRFVIASLESENPCIRGDIDDDKGNIEITKEMGLLQLRAAKAFAITAYTLTVTSGGRDPQKGVEDKVINFVQNAQDAASQAHNIFRVLPPCSDECAEMGKRTANLELAVVHSFLSQCHMFRGERECVDHAKFAVAFSLASEQKDQEECEDFEEKVNFLRSNDDDEDDNNNKSHSSDYQQRLSYEVALFKANIVACRMTCNELITVEKEADLKNIEASLLALVGAANPSYCRTCLLHAQGIRFNNFKKSAEMTKSCLSALQSGMNTLHLDYPITIALAAVQDYEEGKRVLLGPQRSEAFERAYDRVNQLVDALVQIDIINSTLDLAGTCHSPIDLIFERVLAPIIIAISSACARPPPPEVRRRLEACPDGATELDLGQCCYLVSDLEGAHMHFANALKAADTINSIFLLGRLFKPAIHLGPTEVQERNRIASDRLQPMQALQFASILYSIACTYQMQGNVEDAQNTFLQCQAALELARASLSLGLALVLDSIAKLLYTEGHYGDALAHSQKAENLVRDYHVTVGNECPNMRSHISDQGIVVLRDVEETERIIEMMMKQKGYIVSKHLDGRYRFVVYL